MKVKTQFNQISGNQWTFEFDGSKFMLKETSRGVYGIGKSIGLYHMVGYKNIFLKEIGWTKSDNHTHDYPEAYITNRIATWNECMEAAVDYLIKLKG